MRIQICSDLHLEFSDIDIVNKNNADVLILSGDIMTGHRLHDHPEDATNVPAISAGREMATRYRNFLKRCSERFPHVVYVAGNHEFYHGKFYETLNDLRNESMKFSNVYFLEDEVKEINDIVFMGATLWTDCNKSDPLTLQSLSSMMNDFTTIRNDQAGYTRLRPVHIAIRHAQTLKFFKKTLGDYRSNGSRKTNKVVVVGHHAPSHMSIADEYKRDFHMNGGYASDLSAFILDHPEITLWTHGHMHQTFDYMIGSTRIVCNPRGYADYGEKSGWDQNLTIEI